MKLILCARANFSLLHQWSVSRNTSFKLPVIFLTSLSINKIPPHIPLQFVKVIYFENFHTIWISFISNFIFLTAFGGSYILAGTGFIDNARNVATKLDRKDDREMHFLSPQANDSAINLILLFRSCLFTQRKSPFESEETFNCIKMKTCNFFTNGSSFEV